MKILSTSDIKQRLQKLRNYERVLYPRLLERSDKMRVKNRLLQEEVKQLREENKQIEKLRLELEELRAMKFGRIRDDKHCRAKKLPHFKKDRGEKVERAAASYRRQLSTEDQITDRLHLELDACPECGEILIEKKQHIHYREDLYEIENLLKSAKKIVETMIESGKCPKCGTRRYAMEVPKQQVIIGENIRMMVIYQIIVQGQSYSESQKSMQQLFGSNLSSGEIANILEGESKVLTPCYNHIVETLEKEGQVTGNHYDETTWKTRSRGPVVSEGNYCWVKVGVQSEYRLIWFGRSRGKGVAEKMRGIKKGSLGVSDDYGSYDYLFEYHQLCWAHPHRKLRDLAESSVLSRTTRRVCQRTYQKFASLYQQCQVAREQLLAKAWTDVQKMEERIRLEKLFDELCESDVQDPAKLKTIRKSLQGNKAKYFTFFNHPFLPLDNNKAERAIRKLVIKRKKSFGCQSQKGADVLSILYSVVFSLMESHPTESFFDLYRQAKEFEPLSE